MYNYCSSSLLISTSSTYHGRPSDKDLSQYRPRHSVDYNNELSLYERYCLRSKSSNYYRQSNTIHSSNKKFPNDNNNNDNFNTDDNHKSLKMNKTSYKLLSTPRSRLNLYSYPVDLYSIISINLNITDQIRRKVQK